jgi:hypothetical protein
LPAALEPEPFFFVAAAAEVVGAGFFFVFMMIPQYANTGLCGAGALAREKAGCAK